MTPMERCRDRYQNDPAYHHVVDALRAMIESLELAPSEVREAAMLACCMVEERRPCPVAPAPRRKPCPVDCLCLCHDTGSGTELTALLAEVRAEERELCAKVCEALGRVPECAETCHHLAARIREGK